MVDIGAYEFSWIYIGDFETQCDVDLGDFAFFAAHWLDTDCHACAGADLTGDGDVDFNDLRDFAANWLAGVDN